MLLWPSVAGCGVAIWQNQRNTTNKYRQRENMNAAGGVGVTLARSFLARWCGLLAGEAGGGGCPGAEEVTKSHACTLLHCTAGCLHILSLAIV